MTFHLLLFSDQRPTWTIGLIVMPFSPGQGLNLYGSE